MVNHKPKTIWYCHHYAGSPLKGMSYRPYYLARAFNKMGHKAFVIGASFHHLQHQLSISQKDPIHLDNSEGVPFLTLKTRQYGGSGVGRLLNSLDYAGGFKKNLKAIIDITGIPDVIIVSSGHPFHYPILQKIANKFKARLIFEVRDLWPLSLQELLKLPKLHPLCLWLQRIETKAYRQSDYVVSLLDHAFSYMNARGVSKERFRVIPNGICTEEYQKQFPLSEKVLTLLQSLKSSGKFLLGYAGALGKPNAMVFLVEAMKIVADKGLPIHAVLVGAGNLKTDLECKAQELGLSNISFLPPISKNEIPAFLHEMDMLYLGWNDVNLYRYGVSPNKLFDYMMSEKPIVESGGAPAPLIEEAGCGIHCKAESAEEIAKSLVKMYSLSPEKRREMGQKGKEKVLCSYDYRSLAEQYTELM